MRREGGEGREGGREEGCQFLQRCKKKKCIMYIHVYMYMYTPSKLLHVYMYMYVVVIHWQ